MRGLNNSYIEDLERLNAFIEQGGWAGDTFGVVVQDELVLTTNDPVTCEACVRLLIHRHPNAPRARACRIDGRPGGIYAGYEFPGTTDRSLDGPTESSKETKKRKGQNPK